MQEVGKIIKKFDDIESFIDEIRTVHHHNERNTIANIVSVRESLPNNSNLTIPELSAIIMTCFVFEFAI